jgi:aryl-alcohol dehydrogenase-like predicted oxidoreductase
VNYIAISDTPAWQVSRANAIADLRGWSPFIAYQGRYNIGIRDQENDIMPMAKELGLGLVK